MFNIGGGELLVILLVALIVLGPDKLPEAARKVGSVMGEIRKYSSGFQNELRNAMDEPIESEARTKGAKLAKGAKASKETPDPAPAAGEAGAADPSASSPGDTPPPTDPDVNTDTDVSANGRVKASSNGAPRKRRSRPLQANRTDDRSSS
ncbi:hypothetical protein BH20ACT2_BH20ACT2_06420 [soil metagenome]